MFSDIEQKAIQTKFKIVLTVEAILFCWLAFK